MTNSVALERTLNLNEIRNKADVFDLSTLARGHGDVPSEGADERLKATSRSQDALNVIRINVEEGKLSLIGERAGQKIGKQFIQVGFKKGSQNVIKFPDSIERVTISFIEGMVSTLPKGISRENFYNYFSIEGDKKVIKKFQEVIMMNV